MSLRYCTSTAIVLCILRRCRCLRCCGLFPLPIHWTYQKVPTQDQHSAVVLTKYLCVMHCRLEMKSFSDKNTYILKLTVVTAAFLRLLSIYKMIVFLCFTPILLWKISLTDIQILGSGFSLLNKQKVKRNLNGFLVIFLAEALAAADVLVKRCQCCKIMMSTGRRCILFDFYIKKTRIFLLPSFTSKLYFEIFFKTFSLRLFCCSKY